MNAAPPRIPALPTLDPALLLPSLAPLRPARFPFQPDDVPTHLFYLARAGVYHAVRQLLHDRPGTVLMPAYHHGVEVEAVRAAGAQIAFYRVDENLRIDLDDLRALARRPGVRGLYVIHFLGLPQPVEAVRALARERDQFVIEDCALALLSETPDGRPLGSVGDAAVFCLYKSLPVPHGGLLRGASPRASPRPPPFGPTVRHLAGRILAHLALRGDGAGPALGRTARRLFRRVARHHQTGTSTCAPRSWASAPRR